MEGKVMPMLGGRGSFLRAEPGLLLGECQWYPDGPASPPAAGSSLLAIYASSPSLVHLPADRRGYEPVLPDSREPGFEPIFWSKDDPELPWAGPCREPFSSEWATRNNCYPWRLLP